MFNLYYFYANMVLKFSLTQDSRRKTLNAIVIARSRATRRSHPLIPTSFSFPIIVIARFAVSKSRRSHPYLPTYSLLLSFLITIKHNWMRLPRSLHSLAVTRKSFIFLFLHRYTIYGTLTSWCAKNFSCYERKNKTKIENCRCKSYNTEEILVFTNYKSGNQYGSLVN